jgi:hypothetical protein
LIASDIARLEARDRQWRRRLKRASKLGGCRGREAAEEAARQPRAIVDDDPLTSLAGRIQNHSKHLTQASLPRQSIDGLGSYP